MAQVFTRDVRLDATKTAITFAVLGDSDPDNRSWMVQRWGEAGSPREITKDVSHATTADGLDSSSTTGLIDRELFRALRERALMFRLRGTRRTGFRVRSISVAHSKAVFVGEGSPIPVLQPQISNAGLEPSKIASLSVWTLEALREAPGLEELVFNDLVRATADAMDDAMFDPLNDGSGIAPASLTNGATAIAASADFANDLADLLDAFPGNLAGSYFVTTPRVGAGLSGVPSGRDVGARGGELAGIPVLTSPGAPDGMLTLVDPSSVMTAWDELTEIQTSEAGTVEMLDSGFVQDPSSGTGALLVPLWQSNLRAIRSLTRAAWKPARPAAAYISGLFPAAAS